MRFFRFWQISVFLFHYIISKVVGFHLSYKNNLDRGCSIFGLFMACFRFFYEELSLMPER